MDATVAPADNKFPTDIDLLNQCREHLETAIDLHWPEVPHTGHKLPYSARKARKSYLKIAKSKRWTKKLLQKGIREQLEYIERAQARLSQMMELAPKVKLPSWLEQRLTVIPLVYAQQKQMLETKPTPVRTGSSALRNRMCGPFSAESVQIRRSLDRSCICQG